MSIIPATVAEWQTFFLHLYGDLNKRRKDFEIFTRLVEHIGLLSRVTTIRTDAARFRNQSVSVGTKGTAQYFLARSISWYFGLANSCGISVVDSVWAKYPGICPYCLNSTCRCYELDDLPPYEPHRVGNVANSNKSAFLPGLYAFDHWQRHFKKIYRINKKFPLEQIFLHLFEELAEVAEALRLSRKDHLQEDELADVFAWLMAIINALGLDDGAIQALLLSQYANGCPQCQRTPCSCEIRLDLRRVDPYGGVPKVPSRVIEAIVTATAEATPVFIIHGKDSIALHKLERFLRSLGIKPVIAECEASYGRALDNLVQESMASCCCVIALATKDDQVEGRYQPRQNVPHEIGRAQEKFKNRIIYLKEEGCDFPSNISPMVWENFTQDNMEKAFDKVVRELRAFDVVYSR